MERSGQNGKTGTRLRKNGTRHKLRLSPKLAPEGEIKKIDDMKKRILFLCSGILFLFCVPCISQNVSSTYNTGFDLPTVFSTDSAIYFCAKYVISYQKEYPSQDYEAREVCSCHQTLIRLLEWETKRHTDTAYDRSGANTIIIWDKYFIFNYILPLFKKKEDIKKIEYTLAHSDSNTFTVDKR